MNKIRIEATVAAPVRKVWAVWTQPEHITQWNFAVDDWQCPRASNDLRVGGKTQVTTVFDAESQNSEEMQKSGWQAILNNFKKYAEKAS